MFRLHHSQAEICVRNCSTIQRVRHTQEYTDSMITFKRKLHLLAWYKKYNFIDPSDVATVLAFPDLKDNISIY